MKYNTPEEKAAKAAYDRTYRERKREHLRELAHVRYENRDRSPEAEEKRRKARRARYQGAKVTLLEQQRAYRKAHPERRLATVRAYRASHVEALLVEAARLRARKNGISFDLEVTDITIPEFCPVLGIPMRRSETGRAEDYSPSIDRLIGDRGYVVGNVAIISNRANTLKGDGSASEHELIAAWMRGPRVDPANVGTVKDRKRIRKTTQDRARKGGLAFDLIWSDIVIPAVCPVLGLPLSLARNGMRSEATATVDRIDNTRGYERGNVAVISWRANRLKNTGTAEEHEKIAAWMKTKGLP